MGKKRQLICLAAAVAAAAILLTGTACMWSAGGNIPRQGVVKDHSDVGPSNKHMHPVEFQLPHARARVLYLYKPESCTLQAHKGDKIKVHYRGALTDGSVFDSGYDRGDPFEFTLGNGQVIKGWDQGLLGMCVGEKRKLKIPAKMGYGERGSPPKIPGGATLVFDTELIAVNGKTSGGANPETESEL
ncbi:Peptidyl-prolyl cis-trans isomerase [Zea mays]|uniref:peptidylprolyl isomerase n=1 Tax=Zea mays TaxID=4577 RepID=A0A1D6G6B1_MAIZE|nr:Peptidyl-prolyl cis-trans isomerase [Zea mays]